MCVSARNVCYNKNLLVYDRATCIFTLVKINQTPVTYSLSLTDSIKKLKQMLKMMSLHMDAGPKSLPPFTNGCIDDCLLHVRPHLNQTLFQLIHVRHEFLVHAFLNTASNLVIDRVKVRAVRWP